MPRNEVLEGMAKKLHQIDFEDYAASGCYIQPWEKMAESHRQHYRNNALELLGIVEENIEDRGGEPNDELWKAFQLAREARGERVTP